MRILLTAAFAAAALLGAGAAVAQDEHAAHHPATEAAPAPAAPSSNMDPAAKRQMCMGMMGQHMGDKHMDGQTMPGRGGGAQAMPMGPNGKPMTPEEMAARRQMCAGMMQAQPAPDAPAPK